MSNPKPSAVAEWATGDAAAIVEPMAGEKATGWVAGQTPPAAYMNWIQGGDFGTTLWLKYLQTYEENAFTWLLRQTYQSGIAVSGTRSTIAGGLDVTGGATVGGGLTVTGGYTIAGGLGTDTLTASGAIVGASLSAGSGALTAGAATLASAAISGTATAGTVQTATLSPATTDGTITTAGSHTLTGAGATLTAPIISATTGTFTGDVSLPNGGTYFRGEVEVPAVSIIGVAVPFLNSWTQITTNRSYYQKDRAGRVWLYLEDVYGGVVGSGTPIFTLPVGYRPTKETRLLTTLITASPPVMLVLYVTTGGSVYVLHSGGTGLNGTTLTGSTPFTANGSVLLVS